MTVRLFAVGTVAFSLAIAATFADRVGGVGGDVLSLTYGVVAAACIGWASGRDQR